MAGYNDTRRMIVKTLMGRPTGTEIQPEDHQAFALQITDYVRSVELLAGNATPIGFAEADTVPVRPNNGQALYLSQVNRGETVTFNNFIDQDGNAITVSSDENTITLVNLLWNTLYWTKQETHISLEKSVHGDDIVDGAVTTPKIADGAVTDTKLSAEVQAILNDVANKQNITDESLATIAKTIVGAINEVYKGGLEDASIATSKIEDGAITEPKLDTTLKTKVNNNVKVVEQALTDAEIDISSKNLKFRDENGNFFADKASYDAVAKLSTKPQFSVFGTKCTENNFGAGCEDNVFGNKFVSNTLAAGCSSNTFGNNCTENILGSYCTGCTFGNNCYGNKIDLYCYGVLIGNYCRNNKLGGHLKYIKIDDGVSNVVLIHNAALTMQYLSNIHILSGVYGKNDEALVIRIPDEYLNSPRELIITTKRTDGGPSTPKDLVMYYADEVVDKQNKQDTTLETTSKEVVGAINELFNGGVKDGSIDVSKLAQAIQDTLGKVGVNVKAINADTDLNDLKEEGIYVLMSNNIYSNLPVSDGVSMTSQRLLYPSILLVSDYVVANNPVQTYIGLSSIYSYPLIKWRQYQENVSKWLDWGGNDVYGIKKDVTTLQGLINTKVKIINKDTDLNTLTEDGLYLLSAAHSYTNYPLNDGAEGKSMYIMNAALLIVSRRYTETQISQVVLSVSNVYTFPLARNRSYSESSWSPWNDDRMYKEIWQGVQNSVKKQDLSALTDTEVNNIWDNN